MALGTARFPSIRACLSALGWLLVLALSTRPAEALNAARTIGQYRHSRWTIDDGAPTGVRAIAQTPDGYLWIGSSTGLYRFDGLRFEAVRPVDNDPLRSSQVTALLADSRGDLWVGYDYGGIGVVRGGRLLNANPREPSGMVLKIVETRDGAIWVGSASKSGTILLRYKDGRWKQIAITTQRSLDQFQSMIATRDGGLVIGLDPSILRLPPGSDRPVPASSDGDYALAFAQAKDGHIWAADDNGLRILGSPRSATLPLPATGGVYAERSILFDRDGNLWLAGQASGLARVGAAAIATGHPAPADLQVLKAEPGEDARTSAIFEDREGNIWFGGPSGIDRLSPTAIVAEPFADAATSGFVRGNAAGSPLFVATMSGLYEIAGSPPRFRLRVPLGGIFNLCGTRSQGILLLSDGKGVFRWNADHLSRTGGSMPGQQTFLSCTEDGAGHIWAATLTGLQRLDGRHWIDAGGAPVAYQLLRGDRRGGLFAYRPLKSLSRVEAGAVRPLWQGRAIRIGFIRTLVSTKGGYLIGGERGLAFYDGQRFRSLTDDVYPWLSGLTGIAPTATGSVWLIGAQGINRVSNDDLMRSFRSPGTALPHQGFGDAQGFRGRPARYDANDAEIDSEGRIWFITNKGFAWIDPANIPHNGIPPHLVITAVQANGKNYALSSALRLPRGTTNVQIDFAALSLTDARANRYRYRLDGVDTDWRDPGNRTSASYSNLTPGRYRFQVEAANNDGVWTKAPTTLDFNITPRFYQTRLFLIGLLIVSAIALWFLYAWRLRQNAERTRSRIEAQIGERERIARELHDTLLQGLHGLMLRFQGIARRLPDASPLKEDMETVLERGDDILIEGRDRVLDLRVRSGPADLEARIRQIISVTLHEDRPSHSLTISGERRDVCAPVVDEIGIMLREALTNVVRHAAASRVAIHLLYRRQAIVVRIQDDGIGLSTSKAMKTACDRQFGLHGMRERANRIGATIEIEDAPQAGTLVQIMVPALVAYSKRAGLMRWFVR